MKIFNWQNLTPEQQCTILQRPKSGSREKLQQEIKNILAQVLAEGDTAVKRFTEKFDKIIIENSKVTANEFEQAEKLVPQASKNAIISALTQIEKFHALQYPKASRLETLPGVICEKQPRPIQRVGLYVPGGTAPLISTVLMLGIPAKIASCPLRIMCTPPQIDGAINPYILWTAQQCGITKIFKIGGAQAIAAMAYGTETVPKVDKIFGPGNSWVTYAKLAVAQDPHGAAYDLPAGPTEVMIIADDSANPHFIAADLLSQAEHNNDSQVILVCDTPQLAEQVKKALCTQLKKLSRAAIIKQALKNSFILLVKNLAHAIAIANNYAPEHLLLQIKQPRKYLSDIYNAGSIFLGHLTPEAVGDYASGTNHILPTYGYAHAYSGLSVYDFMKQITLQELTQLGLQNIGHTVMHLAELEQLDAHKNAVAIRLQRSSI